MSIRPATSDDIAAIVTGGAHFSRLTPFASVSEYDPEDVKTLIAKLIEKMESDGDAAVFVGEVSGRRVGAIVGILTPLWYSPATLFGSVLAWDVYEADRGVVSWRLLKTFERWAVERGARAVVVSDLLSPGVPALDGMLSRAGFRLAERSFFKETNYG